jgi:hypothetical protein
VAKKERGFTPLRQRTLAHALTELLRELKWIGLRERFEPRFEVTTEPESELSRTLKRAVRESKGGKNKNGRAR